jgi:hypothetical protein
VKLFTVNTSDFTFRHAAQVDDDLLVVAIAGAGAVVAGVD